MGGRAIVCGGSIGGLFAAAFLRRSGWDVVVLERARSELAGRGAGIVTHDVLIRLIEAAGASTDHLGVRVEERVAYDIDGRRVATLALPQIVTSWDRVHSSLRALTPPGGYRLGAAVTAIEIGAGGVAARCEDGTSLEGDVLVGADGFRSVVRARTHPQVQPVYSGYVVWRALADEADLPADVRADVFPHFGFFLPEGAQVLGYPIAGPDNDLRPGRRRYNLVWYAPVPAERLADMLTDAGGARHAMTIPPPLVRDDLLDAMRAGAAALARPFRDIFARSDRPFFTPIYDHCAPTMAVGRVALAGDAACVARPHVGMGVTKAACDAEALARRLAGADAVPAALAAYSDERAPAARIAFEAARRLGGHIAARFPDGARGAGHPALATILAETAVVPAAKRPPEPVEVGSQDAGRIDIAAGFMRTTGPT